MKRAHLKELGWASSARTKDSVKSLNKMLKKYKMNRRLIICHFISQCMAESGCGKWTSESEYLSKERQVAECSKYDYRSDLGNGAPGDGYKYKGVGYIQVTGKYAQRRFGEVMNDPQIEKQGADYILENKEYLWSISTYWWDINNMNRLINYTTSVEAVTSRVNPGMLHLNERKEYFAKCLEVFR